VSLGVYDSLILNRLRQPHRRHTARAQIHWQIGDATLRHVSPQPSRARPSPWPSGRFVQTQTSKSNLAQANLWMLEGSFFFSAHLEVKTWSSLVLKTAA
jgi:hypothetical protein